MNDSCDLSTWQGCLAALRAADWTWPQIGAACGVDRFTANRWGMGTHPPNRSAQKLLAAAARSLRQ
jgi:hypothetical protein